IANMSKEEALASGAMALYDDKYGDTVRVVSVGDYSKELCGGCHVTNSSNIGLFKIETEESVGSGIRRIEAVTGKIAYEALVLEKETVDTISSILKLKNRKEVVNKVTSLTEELNAVKKEVEALNSKLNALNAANRMNDIQDINGVKVLFVEEDMESNKAKQLAFDLRDKIDSGIVILVSKFEEKCSYFVGVSKDYVASGIKAGDVVKKINAIVDGRGGGKPDFAQGGCPVNEKIDTIKDELKNFF
ncbi:MAG: DHHA1 domain-containing protein, partial [Thomasclavelia spiroformis]